MNTAGTFSMLYSKFYNHFELNIDTVDYCFSEVKKCKEADFSYEI